MDGRIEREQEFHDHRYAGGARERASKFYVAARPARSHYRALVKQHARAGDVLEYGCGRGGAAWYLGDVARSITGIDISEVAISLATERIPESSGGATIRFEQMDAEALAFPDDSFDLVCGSGILHHLDLNAVPAEVGRVLRPGGHAVFMEPLGHNPLINLYRRLSPSMRTVDEHPLKMPDLAAFDDGFGAARVRFFALATLGVVPLRKQVRFDLWLQRAARADDWLFARFPWLRRHAWIVVIEVANPSG